MLRDKIVSTLKQVTGSEEIKLDIPSLPEHGDYATNVALSIAKRQNKSPREAAEEIAEALRTNPELENIVEKVEVAGPGFINFFISDKALASSIENTSSDELESSRKSSLSGKNIMVEFTDPNPFKEFHIGHLYSNAVGESVSRLLESQGANVKRACYQGDVGMHVAKSLWGLSKKMAEDGVGVSDLEEMDVESRVRYMGQAYALGASAYEEDSESANEMKAINKKVYEKDGDIYSLYQKGKQWSLEYFEIIYKKLGTKFDYYYFESEAGVAGRDLVLKYLEKGVFEKSQSAVVFPGEKHGLHTRVFINSAGLPTYEAKELGLAPRKYKDFKYDISVIITGNEINEYFKVLLKALEIINPEIAKKTIHLGHGMVRLPEGKMSSRTGKIISGEQLLEQVVSEIRKISKEQDPETIEMVAVAAIKGAFLQSSIGQNIIFDIGKSIRTDGNSGPYLQYTHARTHSILEKVNADSNQNSGLPGKETISLPFDKEERILARVLNYYPEIVQNAAINYSPHILVNYLFDLAQTFNGFYAVERVVGSDRQSSRLFLTYHVGKVIKAGLGLLGIEAPGKM